MSESLPYRERLTRQFPSLSTSDVDFITSDVENGIAVIIGYDPNNQQEVWTFPYNVNELKAEVAKFARANGGLSNPELVAAFCKTKNWSHWSNGAYIAIREKHSRRQALKNASRVIVGANQSANRKKLKRFPEKLEELFRNARRRRNQNL